MCVYSHDDFNGGLVLVGLSAARGGRKAMLEAVLSADVVKRGLLASSKSIWYTIPTYELLLPKRERKALAEKTNF